jgi:hypothetical protein
MMAPVEVERVERIYSGELRCPLCEWVAMRTGATEDDVVAVLRARWRTHLARVHHPEPPA